jgi:hypothetical protein
LRSKGIFLTGNELSTHLASKILEHAENIERFVDPACGAGDLLIACAYNFPVKGSLKQTLTEWNDRLMGSDIVPQLVQATRLRLALTAAVRGAKVDISSREVRKILSNIKLRNALHAWEVAPGSVLVLNPPFTLGKATRTCSWATGRITRAARFVERCLKAGPTGTMIAAILPEVLRTGPRYRSWRVFVEQNAEILDVCSLGLFDTVTDVDVFSLFLRVGHGARSRIGSWLQPQTDQRTTVGDLFDVHVGAVVPYRHPDLGAWCLYIQPRVLPPWRTVDQVSQRIRSMHVCQPPFVAIRRTSRPGDKFRCIGTLVSCGRPVAVENHLIVASPKDGAAETCRALLQNLQKDATNKWFDSTSRCRHLTVRAVRDLPLWGRLK